MRRHSRNWTLAIIITATSAVCAAGPAPAPQALQALDRFLATDCETGEQESSLTRLLEHGAELEAELERIVSDGPKAEQLAEARSAIEWRWEERQAFLESGGRTGLDAQTAVGVLAVSREEWIDRRLRRYDLTVREKAVVGLLSIDSPRALRRLRRLAEQSPPEVAELIRTALARQPSSPGAAATRVHAPRSRRTTAAGPN